MRIPVHQFWQRKMTEQVKANAKGETEFELLAPVRGRVIRVDGVNGYFTYEKGERRFHFKVTLSNCPAGASPDAAEESITAVFDMWDKAGWPLRLYLRVPVRSSFLLRYLRLLPLRHQRLALRALTLFFLAINFFSLSLSLQGPRCSVSARPCSTKISNISRKRFRTFSPTWTSRVKSRLIAAVPFKFPLRANLKMS